MSDEPVQRKPEPIEDPKPTATNAPVKQPEEDSKAKFCGKKSNLQIVATTATLENKNVKKRFNNGRIISIRIYREVLIFFEFLK